MPSLSSGASGFKSTDEGKRHIQKPGGAPYRATECAIHRAAVGGMTLCGHDNGVTSSVERIGYHCHQWAAYRRISQAANSNPGPKSAPEAIAWRHASPISAQRFSYLSLFDGTFCATV
jgi:hypothetical protein